MTNRRSITNSILFITQGGIETASSRFRVFSFIDKFTDKGVKTKILELPPRRKTMKRIGFLFNVLLFASKFRVVFIQKVLFPIWLLKLLRTINKRIVYDWDDALFSSPPSNIFSKKKKLANKQKLDYVLSICNLALCGNTYLEEYAKRYTNRTIVIPTSVNENQPKPINKRKSNLINIGWIGRSENLIYLQDLRDVFAKIEDKYGDMVRIVIVCDQPLIIDGVSNIDNITWRLNNESSDIRTFDIGIMPLSNNEWTRGKCAFKLLQYMGAGVPCIGSPVGANNDVITHNYNGILAQSTTEWLNAIEKMIEQPEKRKYYSQNALVTIKSAYSSDVIFTKLLHALEDLV